MPLLIDAFSDRESVSLALGEMFSITIMSSPERRFRVELLRG